MTEAWQPGEAPEGDEPDLHPVILALVLSAVYGVLCASYIVLSGRVAAERATDVPELAQIEMLKGLGFVAATALVFFAFAWLLLHRLAARQRVVLAQRRALVAADRRALAGLFCASVAHDINNVLTVANAHVEQLGPQATPERRGPAFEAVRGALADLGALAKRMVALERGHGVPELRDRIFDGFITTKPDGSGLGLLSVRVTVAEHGGSVALGESDLGGAAFIVSLPAEPPPA